MKTVCFLKPYLNFSGLYYTDLLPCLYVQTLQEFNLFWLTSIPQSFAPQWNIPLYHSLVSKPTISWFIVHHFWVDTIFFEKHLWGYTHLVHRQRCQVILWFFNHPGTLYYTTQQWSNYSRVAHANFFVWSTAIMRIKWIFNT